MANITQLIDVNNVKNKYNLSFFIETGTGMGESIEQIYSMDFDYIQSCEINDLQYEILKKKFTNKKIKIYLGKSLDCLPIMCNNINGPALFFLDAHFPGQGYTTSNFVDDSYKIDEIIPLKLELDVLKTFKFIDDSVIIIDDLRIYKKNEYESGDWEYGRTLLKYPDPSFIDNFLAETHIKIEHKSHQGSVHFYPKTKI